MASLGIDGLVSGLDTTTLINSLMASEAVPQTILKNKVTVDQTLVTALQGLNTKVADLATLAKKASAVDSLAVSTATSSSTSVTAATTAGAIARPARLHGRLDGPGEGRRHRRDDRLARQRPRPLTFVGAGGKTTEVTAASSSLDDVVTAVNASADAGRRGRPRSPPARTPRRHALPPAADLRDERGRGRLRGPPRHGAEPSPTDRPRTCSPQPGAAVVKQARDASVTLWAGTAAEQVVTSATNTFSDLLPGVSVTVAATAKADEAVTVTVARDTAAASKVASDLVDRPERRADADRAALGQHDQHERHRDDLGHGRGLHRQLDHPRGRRSGCRRR